MGRYQNVGYEAHPLTPSQLERLEREYDYLRDVKLRYREKLGRLPNVVGVGIGRKRIAGKNTGQRVIRVYVSRKVPLDILQEEEQIPPVLDDVPIDVIEVGIVQPIGYLERERPVHGGTSGGDPTYSGTIGVLCRDNTDNTGVLLSNNHIFSLHDDVVRNVAVEGTPIIQPSVAEGGSAPADTVAELKRWVKFVFPPEWNQVDAAIAEVINPNIAVPEIHDIGVAVGTRTLGAADEGVTTVCKTGATSGYTTGLVSDIAFDAMAIDYGEGATWFENQIYIEDVGGDFALSGDSGAAVLDLQNRLVGLLFAKVALPYPGALANHIQEVYSALGIRTYIATMAQNVFAWWEPDDEYVRYCRSRDGGLIWETPVDYDFYVQTLYIGAHVSGHVLNTIWYQYCGDEGYARLISSVDDGLTWQDYELVEIIPGNYSQSATYISADGTLRMVWFSGYDADYPDLSNRIYCGTGKLSGGSISGFASHLIKELEVPERTEVSFDIIDGNDDVQGAPFSKTGTALTSGRDGGGARYHYALRFQNVAIARNSVIWSAILRYIASANQSGTTHRVRFWAEDVDNATQIADAADFNSRVLTSAVTGWNTAPAWVKDQSYNSPELKGQVREVTRRPGWVSGNALQIICQDNMSTAGALRQFYSLEGGTPARLTVNYSPAFDILKVTPDSSGCDLCWAGDTIYVAWRTETYDLPSPEKLYFSKSADGITWSEALKILDTDDLELYTRCYNVRLRRDSTGRLIILVGLGFANTEWRLYISEDDGDTWEPHTFVLDCGYTQATLDLDSADNIYVAYINDVDQRLYIKKSVDHGETFGDAVRVTAESFTYDWFHDVAVDSQDNIHVLTESGYPDRMYHHVSLDGGLTFAGPDLIDDSETPYGTGARLFVGRVVERRRPEVQFLLA